MFKRKIETIPFREFLGGHTEKRMSPTPIVYGLVPGMSIDRFFDMTPQVAGAYALVLGVGGLAIISHLLEVNFAKTGLENISFIVEGFTRFILPVAAYGFMLYVLYKLAGGL